MNFSRLETDSKLFDLLQWMKIELRESLLSERERKFLKFLKFCVLIEAQNFSRQCSSELKKEPAVKASETTVKKVNIDVEQKPLIDVYNEPLYNADGKRNTNVPFDLFVIRKIQEERQNNKKAISVSNASNKERLMFEKAIKKVKSERESRRKQERLALKRLAKSRSSKKDPEVSFKPSKKLRDGRGDDDCPMSCPRPPLRKPSQSPPRKLTAKELKQKKEEEIAKQVKELRKARKKKQVVKYPPVKTKKWVPPKTPAEAAAASKDAKKIVRTVRPVIVIPPFKTRKWVPEPRVKPKPKIKIEYPPCTLRKK